MTPILLRENPVVLVYEGEMADEASLWTTKEIIYTVLGTGVLSGSASLILDYLRGQFSQKRKRDYLCIRIATALEAYAINCAELVEASDAYYGQTKVPLQVKLPDPPIYPSDVDWHSIDPRTADRVLSFLNECEARAADARFVVHFEGNPFGGEEAAKAIGKKAYELATELRGKANLQPPDFEKALRPLSN